MEKVQYFTGASLCGEYCRPAEDGSCCVPSSSAARCGLKFGVMVLIAATVVMMCASVVSLHMWKFSDKNVYSIRYSWSINGEVREDSMEIDSDNNLQRFQTGSEAKEAVEIHDFQIGISAIRFFGGDKCFVKSQIKANLPLSGVHNKEALMFDLTDEFMPVKYDEECLVWIAEKQPVKNTTFLSKTILDLCGERPIFWIHPVNPRKKQNNLKDGELKGRGTRRARRQLEMEENKAAAEVGDESRVVDEAGSAAGSAFNPQNPYHSGGEARQDSSVTFESLLDHRGICCSACRRSYTHCQRVCEPLRGYWPWPYNYRGCRVACRVIMPCRWWVARIFGLV